MCTRVTYSFINDKKNNKTITGRNTDWFESQKTNLWIYPSGVERDGAAGPDSFKWISKYKSITASCYNFSTSDGMNEKGVVANTLWLADAKFSKLGSIVDKKPISLSIWSQMILDLCADVNEAINLMQKVYVVTTKLPQTGKTALCHLSISDKKGNSAIFEYVDGNLIISTNIKNSNTNTTNTYSIDKMAVMTNEPIFSTQLKLNYFWEYQNEKEFLPGSNQPTNRFVRATYYSKNLQKENVNNYIALASVLTVMHNVAGPIGKINQEKPNVNPTWWTSLSDQEELVYYFEATRSPSIIWLDLKSNLINKQLDQIEKNKALKLTLNKNNAFLINNQLVVGNMEKYLTVSKTFTFLPVSIENTSIIITK